ncbi:hypothetical protein Tco_1006156 [Tanacetum coccineum]|uniref:Uncharacterized protein n=1 Tax=Tanacetum coccineum TaxID=301880 RepID=A0ABQ5FH65_9ASTR
MNNLETPLNAETLNEMDSKSALSAIKGQFERFINSDLLKPLDIFQDLFHCDREEVLPAESSSTDTPLEQVQNNDENNVFANERQHSEKNAAESQSEKPLLYGSHMLASDPTKQILPLDREETMTLDITSCFACQSFCLYDMELLIKTLLMPLSIKSQNDSFRFEHELKTEMHEDFEYVKSLENEVDELESEKADFSNMYDLLIEEKSQSVVAEITDIQKTCARMVTQKMNILGLVLHQMTSDHNRSELGIQDHSNEPSSSKLVPKVVPLAVKTATSQQELELLFHHHIAMLRTTEMSINIDTGV